MAQPLKLLSICWAMAEGETKTKPRKIRARITPSNFAHGGGTERNLSGSLTQEQPALRLAPLNNTRARSSKGSLHVQAVGCRGTRRHRQATRYNGRFRSATSRVAPRDGSGPGSNGRADREDFSTDT